MLNAICNYAKTCCNNWFLPHILSCVIAISLALSPSEPAFAQHSSNSPNAFGSVALRMSRTPLTDKWLSVRNGRFPTNNAALNAFISRNRAVSRDLQIIAVNKWVNSQISYTADQVNHRQSDSWSTVAHTLQSGRGDCEDYAIAKYQTFVALGVPEQDLFLMVGRDRVMRVDHAILLVRFGNDFRVLDNFTDRVLSEAEMVDFLPSFSFSGSQTWIHGFPAQT
jgi:predicted transglutaminase-like cysteine proteinase